MTLRSASGKKNNTVVSGVGKIHVKQACARISGCVGTLKTFRKQNIVSKGGHTAT